jgi:hypothetical protein
MKRKNVLTAAMLVVLLTMVSVAAVAQEKEVEPSKATKTEKLKMSEAPKTKKLVLSEAMQSSPAMLLGKAKELELTESQQVQLVAIMKEMQAKTMAVLTKAQVAKVKAWRPAPKMAQEVKMAPPTKPAEPSGAKTKMAKGSDDAKSQARKVEK